MAFEPKRSFLEALKTRVSTRSYNGKKLPDGLRKLIMDYLKNMFEDKPLFDGDEESKKLRQLLDRKTVLKIITFCEVYDVKTCWIGGKWLTRQLEDHLKKQKEEHLLRDDETVICMTPLGFLGKRGVVDYVSAWWVGARSRLKPSKLYFDAVYGKALKVDEDLKQVFEGFRWAPSAVNKQRWRILKMGKEYHFLTCPSSTFYTNIDIGIAIANFDTACKELKIQGKFSRKKDIEIAMPKTGVYFMTWEKE